MSASGRPVDERVGLMAAALGGRREPEEDGPQPLVSEATVANEEHASYLATAILVLAVVLLAFNVLDVLTTQYVSLFWWGLDAIGFVGGAYWWGRSRGSFD